MGGIAGLQTDSFDIDHAKGLKSLHGTLLVRNASSGAISIIINRPSAMSDSDGYLKGGSYGHFLGCGGITGRLTSDGSLLFWSRPLTTSATR